VTALEQASDSLRRMRESMMWVEANRQEGDERTIQRYLMKAAQAGSEVVASIESL
jgi:hypothetical protein